MGIKSVRALFKLRFGTKKEGQGIRTLVPICHSQFEFNFRFIRFIRT